MKVVEPDGPLAHARDLDVAPHLRTRALARVLEVHPTLPSTSDRALALAQAGAAHGLAVVAMAQTAGRGQRGRRWFSPAGAGLYVSFLLRPDISPRLAPSLTLVAGVATRAALSELCGAEIRLRWPNDVLAGPSTGAPGCKLAGILMEASADQHRVEHAVLGVGVNLTRAAFPEALVGTAASLEDLGRAPGVAEALGALASRLEVELDRVAAQGLGPAAAEWTRHAVGLGETVEVLDGPRVVRGRLEGIAEDGALRLATPGGPRTLYRGALVVPGIPKTPLDF